jgi:hypothetical protein
MRAGTQFGRVAVSTLLVVAGSGAAFAANAQTSPEEWRYRATIYGWFPGLSGTTEFPSGAGGPSIDVNAKDLIDKLKMAFMGTAEAQYGRWGGLVDVFYTNIGSTKTGTREFTIEGQPSAVGVTANLSLDVKTTIVTLAGTYSLMETPTYTTGLVFGARMLNMDQTLDWAFNGTGPSGVGVAGRREASATNWDGIVGVRGRARFGSDLRWFVPYYADLGTGNSKFTWQAMTGIGYAFSWGEIQAAWRYLDYDFKSGEPLQSTTLNGVAVGVSFRF